MLSVRGYGQKRRVNLNFTEHIINISKQKRIENIASLRREIDKPWVQEKINNYLERFENLFDKQELISQIMSNDIVASFFIKDPAKQNLSEKECAKWIGADKLPAQGKNCIRFDAQGNIVSKKDIGVSKSADFSIKGIYFTQKYTGDNSGGAQDNQYEDVVTFLNNGSKKQKVGAIVDGAYWDNLGNREKLITAFASNKNVVVLSADDLKGGKLIGEN